MNQIYGFLPRLQPKSQNAAKNILKDIISLNIIPEFDISSAAETEEWSAVKAPNLSPYHCGYSIQPAVPCFRGDKFTAGFDGKIVLQNRKGIPQGGLTNNGQIIWEPGTYSNAADFNLDGQVNLKDFANFADTWLWQSGWY